MGLMDWDAALVIITGIYTAGTLALWYTTHRSYKAMRDALKLNFLVALHTAQQSSSSRDLFELQAHEYNRAQYETLLQHAFPDMFEEFMREDDTTQEQQEP
jgi:hypothetical protein